VKETPNVGFPFFGTYSSDCLPKAKKDVSVHLFVQSTNYCKLYQRIPVIIQANSGNFTKLLYILV